ncbi:MULTISPECIES: hypothetical protein [Bradyrhizobium]|uniref:hypothetical protein n=1 Tax=Bradyrhizobium TaxID=374 RepID=UPI00137476E0|nr:MULTISPECIES: hypothetical protein [Bradyrhizobium]
MNQEMASQPSQLELGISGPGKKYGLKVSRGQSRERRTSGSIGAHIFSAGSL